MRTTVQKLGVAIEAAQGTIGLCSESKDQSKLAVSLNSSITAVGEAVAYLKENEKRHFIKVRKALGAVYNVLSGMRDGLADKSLTLGEFRRANTTLKEKFFPMVQQGLQEEVEAAEAAEADSEEPSRPVPVPEGVRQRIKIVISKSEEMRDAVNIVSRSNTAGDDIGVDGKESELETLSKLARNTLPVRVKGAFQIVRVPIVPVFPNPELSKSRTLNSLGLKFTEVEGFIILKDQILLLVSKQRAEKTNVTPLAMAHSVVELLNDRGAVKYEIVSDTPNANPRNSDLLMFWILPRQRMNGLMKILGASRKSATVKWGLPFPSEKAETERRRIEKQREQDEALERQRQAELDRIAQEREAKEQARQASRDRAKATRAEADRQAVEEKKKRLAAQQERLSKRNDKDQTHLQNKLQALVRKNREQHGLPFGKKAKKR